MATVRLRSSLCSVAPYSAYGCVKLHGGTRGPRLRRHCLLLQPLNEIAVVAIGSLRVQEKGALPPTQFWPTKTRKTTTCFACLPPSSSSISLSSRLDCNLNGFLAVRLLSHYDFDPLPPNNP